MPLTLNLSWLKLVVMLTMLTAPAVSQIAPAPTPASTPATAAPTPAGQAADPALRARVSANLAKQPMHFEVNAGQMDTRVQALARGGGYAFFLTQKEAVLSLRRPSTTAKASQADLARDLRPQAPEKIEKIEKVEKLETATLRLKLVGADTSAPWVPEAAQASRSNYFIGNDASKWRTDVAHYGRMRQKGVYPGTDLVYYGSGGTLEYDFILAPGADPNRIALDFKGANGMDLLPNGNLVLHTPSGDVVKGKPDLYQTLEGRRVAVHGAYRKLGQHRIGFQVEAYDRSRELVIDPTLVFSSYLGGSNTDEAFCIAMDAGGNILVAGGTSSIDFPTTVSALQTTNAGLYDIFVAKLNPAGSALVYSTYLGGSSSDMANGIAVDASGNALVTGYTNSPNFPTTIGAFQTINAGNSEAFVAKLNPTGSALVYSTYLGGNSVDIACSIAMDASGNALVTGYTNSPNFPTTAGAFQTTNAGSWDAFVAKLNPTGSALVYSTYLGGSSNDYAFGIAVDASGNALVTGYTYSTDLPTTVGAFQTTIAGVNDAFVAKLNPAGSALIYSTYLGGSSNNNARGIAVDASGNALVTGYTNSTNFPTTVGAFQITNAGGQDAFLAKLNSAGSALVYSTYLGGTSSDQASGIAVDGSGNALVTGTTNSTNFPTTVGAFQTTNAGNQDAFVAKLNSAGSALVYSTYLGGTLSDQASGIAVDASGNALVTGFTYSSNFPTTVGAFQTTNAGTFGTYDAFVAKISAYAYPASVAVQSGTPQSTALNTAFAAPLVAKVVDSTLAPVPDVTVTFTPPGAGASGAFPGALTTFTAVTDAAGLATSPLFTANGTAGSYGVNATLLDTAAPAVFNLTNTSASFDTEPNNTYATAQPVGVPGTLQGSIGVNGDIDYFRLILPGRATLRATLTPPPGLRYFLYIYNQVGRIVAQSTLAGGATQTCWWTNPIGYGQYCYAVVRAPAGVFSASQAYQLTLNW